MNYVLAFLALLLVFGVAVGVISVSDGINNRNNAKAYATTLRAESRAAAAAQSLAEKEAKETERAKLWSDTYPARLASWVLVLFTLGLVGMLFISTAGVSASVFVAKLSVIKSHEFAYRAALIKPDSCGFFPLIPDDINNPRFLSNPNNGKVWRLAEVQDHSPQLADGYTAVQLSVTSQKDGLVLRGKS